MNDKIGLLYRVSSKPQETDGGSLGVQKKMGRKISKSLGIDFLEFDEGVQSSYKVEVNFRPKLVELLDSIQKNDGIRKVWVFNPDRLGRTSESWYSIIKVFLDYGVQIYIGEDYKKPYDLTNSVDKLAIGVLSLISQYDNELRRLRSIIGKRNSLRNGNTYLGSIVPFGYSVMNKKLTENKDESPYVKDIYRMYDEGKSTKSIKLYLDRQLDINPRRTEFGWNLGTIQKMMRNTLYVGKQKWVWKEKLPNGEEQIVETIEIKTPALVEKSLWDRVNHKMDLHKRKVQRNKVKNESSLLKGILKCNKCGLTLNDRYRESNHYYGRCTEYKWKYNGAKYNSSNCDISKSLRIEETDEKVLNTVIEIIGQSSKLREEYKIKNLSPKWENEKENRKNITRIKKYLREKNNERENCENEVVQIEFEIRKSKSSTSIQEKLKQKFQEAIKHLNKEIERLEADLKVYSNSKGWVNWLNNMAKGLDKVKNSSNESKKEFLNKHIREIEVQYDNNIKSHKLDIRFKYPIVGDMFQYSKGGDMDNEGFKKYQISDGTDTKILEVPLVNYRKKQNEKVRTQLNNLIIKLKEEKEFSLQEICNELNGLNLLTPTKKKWDKPKLSSYYKSLKEKVPKK